jgi:hypothetical protein
MLQKFWGAKEKNENEKKIYDEKKRKVRKIGRIKVKKRKREKWEGNKIEVKK